MGVILINDKKICDYSTMKDANRMLDSIYNKLKISKEKRKVDKVTDDCFENNYFKLKINDDFTVYFVTSYEELKEKAFSENSYDDATKNTILDIVNIMEKERDINDKNIYIVENTKIIGKSENLEEINKWLKSYFKKNSKYNYEQIDLFLESKEDLANTDGKGIKNVVSFLRKDDTISCIRLIYPMETFYEYTEQILKHANYNDLKLIKLFHSHRIIKNINEVEVPILEPLEKKEDLDGPFKEIPESQNNLTIPRGFE